MGGKRERGDLVREPEEVFVNLFGVLLALSLAQDPNVWRSPTARLLENSQTAEWVSDERDDGRYFRFTIEGRGPVHVYVPRFYNPDTAIAVVYLHGFYTDVDRAMEEFFLTQQFRNSGRNALFVIPATRSAPGDPILWPNLEQLLETVRIYTKLPLPMGPTTLIAHSGGYRNVSAWLDHKRLRRVILVDGLYGDEQEFHTWVTRGELRQLVLVGYDTRERAEVVTRNIRQRYSLEIFPYLFDELPARAQRVKVVLIRSERFDHMRLIESGAVIPWLLHSFR